MAASNALLSFAVITCMFATIYKLLPDVKIAWGNVWIGAAVTALLFTLGKLIIGLYLGGRAVVSVYGATGGAHRPPALGLLLGADHLPRGRVHEGLLETARGAAERDRRPVGGREDVEGEALATLVVNKLRRRGG